MDFESSFIAHGFFSRLWLVAPIWIIYLKNLDIPLPVIALMDTAFWGSIFLGEIPTGYVADKFGRKISVILSFIIQGFGILMFGLVTSIPLLMISYMIWGVGITFQSGAEEAWLFDELKLRHQDSYEEVFGKVFAKFSMANAMGFVAASFLGGYLATIDITLPMKITAIFMWITSIYLIIFPSHADQQRSKKEKQLVDAVKSLATKKVITYSIYAITLSSVIGTVIFWIQAYLFDDGYNTEIVGILLAVGIAFQTIGFYISSRVKTEYSKLVFRVFTAIVFFGLLVLGLSSGLAPILGYFVVRISDGIINPILRRDINAELNSDTRATALSVLGSVSVVSLLALEILTAFVIEFFGYSVFFLLSSVIIFLIIPIAFLLGGSVPNSLSI